MRAPEIVAIVVMGLVLVDLLLLRRDDGTRHDPVERPYAKVIKLYRLEPDGRRIYVCSMSWLPREQLGAAVRARCGAGVFSVTTRPGDDTASLLFVPSDNGVVHS